MVGCTTADHVEHFRRCLTCSRINSGSISPSETSRKSLGISASRGVPGPPCTSIVKKAVPSDPLSPYSAPYDCISRAASGWASRQPDGLSRRWKSSAAEPSSAPAASASSLAGRPDRLPPTGPPVKACCATVTRISPRSVYNEPISRAAPPPGVSAVTRSKQPPPPGEPTIHVRLLATTFSKKLEAVSTKRSKKDESTGGKRATVSGRQFELCGHLEPQQRSAVMASAASSCEMNWDLSASKWATARL
eukprot:scaffold12053_cov99-Isochrysis_galbana.AAC.1